MIPLSALTSPVTGITWGDYNASHANVMWQDATSGPTASVYKVTWQDFGGGLLIGTQFACFTGTKVQILTLTRLLTAPIREAIAYGPPALISPVTEGLQYKILVYSRNLNYDPGTQFTCFSSTKVQLLTPEVLRVRSTQSLVGVGWSPNSSKVVVRIVPALIGHYWIDSLRFRVSDSSVGLSWSNTGSLRPRTLVA